MPLIGRGEEKEKGKNLADAPFHTCSSRLPPSLRSPSTPALGIAAGGERGPTSLFPEPEALTGLVPRTEIVIPTTGANLRLSKRPALLIHIGITSPGSGRTPQESATPSRHISGQAHECPQSPRGSRSVGAGETEAAPGAVIPSPCCAATRTIPAHSPYSADSSGPGPEPMKNFSGRNALSPGSKLAGAGRASPWEPCCAVGNGQLEPGCRLGARRPAGAAAGSGPVWSARTGLHRSLPGLKLS